MKFVPLNKVVFTAEERKFLKLNYEKMTNKALAIALGKNLTRTRQELYSMGFKRMELQYWTEEQIQFLRDNYQEIGDTELAELFADRWSKEKGWSKKHIEKKRRYLKLKRTTEQMKSIFFRNKEHGRFKMCSVNAWITRGGPSPEGTVVNWRQNGRIIQMIKVSGRYKHLNVHVWELHNGTVPKGLNVVRKDGNLINNSIENLVLMTDAELAVFNSKNRVKYPEEIKEIEKLIRKINNQIKNHGKK